MSFVQRHERASLWGNNIAFKVITFAGLGFAAWTAIVSYNFYDMRTDSFFYSNLLVGLIAYAAIHVGYMELEKARAIMGMKVLGVLKIGGLVYLFLLGAIMLVRQGSVIYGFRYLGDDVSALNEIIIVSFFAYAWWAFRYTRLNAAVIEASIAAIDEEITKGKAETRLASLQNRPTACQACKEPVSDMNAKYCPQCGKSIKV